MVKIDCQFSSPESQMILASGSTSTMWHLEAVWFRFFLQTHCAKSEPKEKIGSTNRKNQQIFIVQIQTCFPGFKN
jgi:hypothetical protein